MNAGDGAAAELPRKPDVPFNMMPAESPEPPETLPLERMRLRVRDLLAPKPLIYWADFLFHIVLTWSAFVVVAMAEPLSPLQVVAWLVSVFSMYRSVIFIHELSHLRRGTFEWFRWAWNLSCGFPILLPSFVYSGVHNHHHRKNVYGTTEDGEYYPFASRSPLEILGFLALNALLPALLIVRFVLLTPIGWLIPAFHRYLWARASSLTLDARYVRTASDRDESNWRLQEALTFCYGACALTMVSIGFLSWQVLAAWYAMVLGGLLTNAVRTLVAHRYRNASGQPMTITQQFLDSVDVPGHRFLTGLWAPVGLRYHATHHLFPSMPYHNLGQAYRRLHAEFPGVYAEATRRGLLDALRQLWRASRLSRVGTTAPQPVVGSSLTGGEPR